MRDDELLKNLSSIHDAAQAGAVRAVNRYLTARNWLFGAHIFEYEQGGTDRAAYGERLLEQLSGDLALRGLGRSNLFWFRQFALAYPEAAIVHTVRSQFASAPPEIVHTACGLSPAAAFPKLHARTESLFSWRDDAYLARLFEALSWSHFRTLLSLDQPLKRAFHEANCIQHCWSAGLEESLFVSRYLTALPSPEQLEGALRAFPLPDDDQ